MEYQFTIVVPIYNEEENLERLEQQLSTYLEIAVKPTCILLVNDGSSDNSLSMIEKICERNEAFHFISFEKNCGLSAAIKAGFDYADTPLIGYIDSDGIRKSFTHDGMNDTGCPLKIIKADYAKRIPMFKGLHRFLPAMIMLQNGTVKQVPVRHYPRIAGKAKFHLWNRLIGPLVDCFAYLWMKKKYINYNVAKKT